MINLITCVTIFKSKLAIGKDDQLLFRLKDDLKIFKNLTTDSLSANSKLNKNIVLMGRKTWFSIPKNFRPLKNRINLILTNDQNLIKSSAVPKNLDLTKSSFYYTNLQTFNAIYKKYNPNVFVIGGSTIYNYFLSSKSEFPIDKIYLTHVQTNELKDIKFEQKDEPNIFMDHFDSKYKLISYSEKYKSNYNDIVLSYRILTFNLTNKISEEYKYLNHMKNILENGNERSDRTGTGTISIFGNQMRFDISKSIPLITTKRVPFRIIVEELLWMCRGDSDSKILEEKGIGIWTGNTSRKFLDNRGLNHYKEGVLGPQYGFLWRHFGAEYSPDFADTSKCDTSKIGGFDQLRNVENLLRTDPFSRRIMVSAWDPSKMKEQCLPSCHYNFQFYVTEENNQKYLSCMFTMRSSDFDTASCYNVIGYTILTYILAKKHNMKPKEIIYVSGDMHIYKNHLEQVKEQLSRIPRPFPSVKLCDSIITKDWKDITIDDFELIGYLPHKTIPIKMAI